MTFEDAGFDTTAGGKLEIYTSFLTQFSRLSHIKSEILYV